MLVSDGQSGNSRLIIVVLSPTNVARMSQGDPITLDKALGDHRLLIAIDKDADRLSERFPSGVDLEKYLLRGFALDPSTDGPDNLKPGLVLTIPDGPLRNTANQFEEFVNNIVAPYTRAWTNYRLDQVIIRPGDIKKNEARFTLVLSAKRREPAGSGH